METEEAKKDFEKKFCNSLTATVYGLVGELTEKNMQNTILTEEMLSQRWQEVHRENGPFYMIGTNIPSLSRAWSDKHMWNFINALPYYFVSAFFGCEMCGKCCRGEKIHPQNRSYDKGLKLLPEEANALRGKYKVIKEGNLQYIKYPCPMQNDNLCGNHKDRPLACRLFPFVLADTGEEGEQAFYIFMVCDAAKGLYIKSNLFMQEFFKYMQENPLLSDNEIFSMATLEKIRRKFSNNELAEYDLKYIENLAFGD